MDNKDNKDIKNKHTPSASSPLEKEENIGQRAHTPHNEKATASSELEKEEQASSSEVVKETGRGD